MRKTKIIATIGPASESKKTLMQMVDAGINIARLNFSHGTPEHHGELLRMIRKLPMGIGVMMDTQGPEVRLGEIKEGTKLEQGSVVELVRGKILGNSKILPISYTKLLDSLEPGDTILMSDGKLELRVEEVSETARCRVIYGGCISSKKSVNVPGKDIGLQAPTDKDLIDIKFGAKLGFDFVAASFVKSAEDIKKIRKILKDENSEMNIIAKIEHVRAVENIDEILKVSDGAMIARGDLGVEVPASEVPLLQKMIIGKCNLIEKPVIIATQMLMSMTESPRPTRAEVSDVANSVVDGADAVMLSEETAIGKYPVKSVQFMDEILQKMEDFLKGRVHHTVKLESNDTADIIGRIVWQASRDIKAKYIVVHTTSGYTAHKVAKFRPDTEVVVFTNNEMVQKQLNLVWGVQSFLTEFPPHVDEMICNSAEFLYKKGLVSKKDSLILTAGVPAPISGITNMMEIRTVASLLEEKKKISENI